MAHKADCKGWSEEKLRMGLNDPTTKSKPSVDRPAPAKSEEQSIQMDCEQSKCQETIRIIRLAEME